MISRGWSDYDLFMRVKVKSPANIAFIKYWGRADHDLILPYNSSFSMNLSDCFVQVEIILREDDKKLLFIKDYKKDKFRQDTSSPLQKTVDFFHRIRNFFGERQDLGFEVYSSLSFPRQAGIASSAAYFSALALGFCKILGKDVDEKTLSILARLSGSGSAARSVPDGFVLWRKGRDSESCFAYSIAEPSYWDLVDIVVIISDSAKKTTSYSGHKNVETSSLFSERLAGVGKRLKRMLEAFEKKDLERFGKLVEDEALSMHSVMMSQDPPLFYWSCATFELMRKITDLRASGLPVYYTIDAGENLHLITERRYEDKVLKQLRQQSQIKDLISNSPAVGARLV